MAENALELVPSQKKAFDRVLELWPCSDVFILWSRAGMGRTTVLRELAQKLSSTRILDARRYMRDLSSEPPMRLEETFLRRAVEMLERCETLLVDDWDRISCPFGKCNSYYYPRRGLEGS